VSSVTSPDSDTVVNPKTDTFSVGESESSVRITRPAGPRYIFYRVFAEDGAIPSSNPVYSDDPSLGRIVAKLVTPPHTALNLKRCLSGIENIDVNIMTSLYISASSQTPMDDSGRVSILAYPGPGCTPSEPLALVARCTAAGRGPLNVKKPEAVLLPPQEGPTPFETQYLFYRIYKDDGAVLSKQPADPNDPSVGRISVNSVPPPHTAASIMRCISKTEQLDNSKQSQLFVSISSASPIGEGRVSILTSNRPGSTLEDPMAFVESLSPIAASVESVESPAPVAPSMPAPFAPPISHPTYTKQIRVTNVSSHSKQNAGWLAVTKDEILRTTHDPPRQQRYNWYESTHHSSAHKAINAAGKVGFVSAACVEPC